MAFKFDLPGFAEGYQKHLVPYMFTPTANELIKQLSITKGQTLLDVGCGTGIVTWKVAPLIGKMGRIIGLDVNEAMLEVAKRYKPKSIKEDEDCIPQWIHGDAEKLPFPDHSFDIITCQHVIQFVKNPNQAFAEFRRVLKPGGQLGLAVWCSPVERFPMQLDFIQTCKNLGLENLEGLRQPFSWQGGLPRLQTLAESNSFQTNNVFEKLHMVRYPGYETMLRPYLEQEKVRQNPAPEEYQKLEKNVLEMGKKVYASHIHQDGSISGQMPANFLIATRKIDSRL